MAVAFVFEGADITADDYDGLMAALGRADVNAPNPDGLLAHLAGATDRGWRVVDVWESEAAADSFYGSEPFQRMLGDAPPIARTAWPLHRIELEQTTRETR